MNENKKPVCPKCSGYIPNNQQPGAYPGAISRHVVDDNGKPIEICSQCGQNEAIQDWQNAVAQNEGK